MKTSCFQTNEMQYSLRKEKLEQLGKKRKMLALIKSLIYAIEKDALGGGGYKRLTKSLIEFVS